MIRHRLLGLVSALAIAAACGPALGQVGTAITYQGQLKNAGTPVNSPTDMRFSLWTDPAGGTQLGSTVTSLAVPVSQGLFNASMDFGVDPYDSDQAAYLQIDVRNPAGVGAYVPMGSRQRLTAAPYSAATRGLNVNSNGEVAIGSGAWAGLLKFARGGDGGTAGILGWLTPGDDTTLRLANNGGGGILRLDANTATVFHRTTDDAELMRITNGGNVAIGTPTPTARLTVNGTVHSLSGGFKFPDDSTQSTAPIGQRVQDEVLMLGPGSFVAVDTNVVSNNWTYGVFTNSGEMIAPIHLPAGAQILSITVYVYDSVPAENLQFQILGKHNASHTAGTYGVNEVLAGSSGFYNQTFAGGQIINDVEAMMFWVGTANGSWHGANLAIQNVKIVWRMPS